MNPEELLFEAIRQVKERGIKTRIAVHSQGFLALGISEALRIQCDDLLEFEIIPVELRDIYTVGQVLS